MRTAARPDSTLSAARRGPQAVVAMRFPIALLASAALLAPATAHAAVTPPPPTGPAPVGLERLRFTDHHRTERLVAGGGPRLIPLRVWYPAARPGVSPGPVFTVGEQRAFETVLQLPAASLDGMGATTTAGAPPSPGSHPVVLLSPGFGNSSALHSAQATDLASHGYVVVGVDHPGDTVAVDAGGGRILPMDPRGESYILGPGHSYATRVDDLRYVARHLGRVRGAGRFDPSRVGAFGHSVGGRAVLGAMLADRRLDAGVDLDGSAEGPVITRGLDRPVGLAWGDRPVSDSPQLVELRRHLRGPHPFAHWRDTGHGGFTDTVWLAPQLGVPAADAENGTVAPATAVAKERAFLLRFFDRYLRG